MGTLQSVITTEDTDPDPTPQQYFILYRCVLSITTHIGLPAKDTLAIVSNFLPESFDWSNSELFRTGTLLHGTRHIYSVLLHNFQEPV